MKMQKEFVPYELALELKALGFNESCFGVYSEFDKTRVYEEQFIFEGLKVPAPTFSQAFRWFREKYNLFSVCFPQLDIWVIEIKQLGGMEGNPVIQGYPDLEYNTYEQAELACLIKLIQIIKDGNK
jgi:hypothetical protein